MKFLGTYPHRLGVVSRLYDQYTATALTEALFNTFSKEYKANRFQSLNSFMVEWDVEVQRIKRVPLLGAPEGDGLNGSDVMFSFPENYYQRYDVFVVEDSRQQFIVMNRPQRIHDKQWTVVAKILDNDYSSMVDTTATYAGSMTRFVTNHMPEMSEETQLVTSVFLRSLK